MPRLLRKGLHENEDDGFTLIELMVVVLIIAILIAVAIPTFLGAQDRAGDRAAQSDLRNAATTAKTIATDDAGELDTVTESSLTAAEGALTFGSTATTDVVGVTPGTPATDYIQLIKLSTSGKAYAIALAKTGAVRFCKAADLASIPPAGIALGALTGCVDAKW